MHGEKVEVNLGLGDLVRKRLASFNFLSVPHHDTPWYIQKKGTDRHVRRYIRTGMV